MKLEINKMKESTLLRNYKPFEYRVYNKDAELEPYSGGFLTKEDAQKWYDKHGTELEDMFNRRLVLVDNVNAYQYHFNF